MEDMKPRLQNASDPIYCMKCHRRIADDTQVTVIKEGRVTAIIALECQRCRYPHILILNNHVSPAGQTERADQS